MFLTRIPQDIHVQCLYSVHEKHPPLIQDEPKNSDISAFTGFRVNTLHARSSILEFAGILRSRGHGYVNSGEESSDLGIQTHENRTSTGSAEHDPLANALSERRHSGHPLPADIAPASEQPSVQVDTEEQNQAPEFHQDLSQDLLFSQPLPDLDTQLLEGEIFNPFIDPEMLDLFSGGEL